jgi:membrane protein DedA with SNARE-associated domain
MELLISKYGYWIIGLGTFLEGEIILVLGGFWAHLGRLNLNGVMISAYVGTVIGETALYSLGRWKGPGIFERFKFLSRNLPRIKRFTEKFGVWAIYIGRYFYTVRSLGNIFYGASGMPFKKFIPATLLSCAIWTVSVAVAGYVFGQAAEIIFNDIKRYEHILIAVLVMIFLISWLVKQWNRNRNNKISDLP